MSKQTAEDIKIDIEKVNNDNTLTDNQKESKRNEIENRNKKISEDAWSSCITLNSYKMDTFKFEAFKLPMDYKGIDLIHFTK